MPESCVEIVLLCGKCITVELVPLTLLYNKFYVFFPVCETSQTESCQYYSILAKNRLKWHIKGETQGFLVLKTTNKMKTEHSKGIVKENKKKEAKDQAIF